jgi:midasin
VIIENIRPSCAQWLDECPYLDHLLSPMMEWLDSSTIPQLDSQPAEEISTDESTSRAAIDACLVAVQNVLGRCEVPETAAEPSNKDESPDKYLRSENHLICSISEALHADKVLGHLQDSIRSVAQGNGGNIENLIPFVNRYIELAEHQLLSHTSWNKAIFKLCFVLCSTMQNLASQGFCQPPEDEGADEEGAAQDNQQGTGLGEGTGTENVSKEIEEESQVEGLQGDNEKPDNQPHDQDGKDDTIEMADDFGGELEDVPSDQEGEDGEQSDKEGSDDEGPDDAVGDLEAEDPNAVDEKLWGDEKGDTDKSDQKMDEDRSKQESGESDIVAKEGGEKQDPKEKERQEKDDADQADDEDTAEPAEQDLQGEDEQGEDAADAAGAPMEQHVPDANTLELPDDMDLGQDGEEQDQDDGEDLELDGDEEDLPQDEMVEDDLPGEFEQDSAPAHQQESAPDEEDNADNTPPTQAEDSMEEDKPQEDSSEHAIAQPDLTSGDNNADSTQDVGDVQDGEAQGGQGENPSAAAGDLTKEQDESQEYVLLDCL